MKTNGGKYAISDKRGKTSDLSQARENMRPLPNAGKYATSAQRYPAREITDSQTEHENLS